MDGRATFKHGNHIYVRIFVSVIAVTMFVGATEHVSRAICSKDMPYRVILTREWEY